MRLMPYVSFAAGEAAMMTSTPQIDGFLCAKILATRLCFPRAGCARSKTS